MKLLGWLVPVLDEIYPKNIGHFELQTESVLCWTTTLSDCFTGRNLTLIPKIASKEALVRSEQFYSTVADPGEGPAPNPRGAEKNIFEISPQNGLHPLQYMPDSLKVALVIGDWQ